MSPLLIAFIVSLAHLLTLFVDKNTFSVKQEVLLWRYGGSDLIYVLKSLLSTVCQKKTTNLGKVHLDQLYNKVQT